MGEPEVDRRPPSPARPEHPVPSARGRSILIFLGATLVEYWLAPLFVGLTNFAGLWSTVGNALFVALVAALTLLVLRPLLPYLRWAWPVRGTAPLFAALSVAGLLLGLFGTNTLSLPSGPAGPFGAEWIPVYTPFGSFPSLFLTGPLEGVINVEMFVTLGLLAVLGAAAIVVRRATARTTCRAPRATVRRGWGARVAWAAVWSPFGFVSSCSVCTPAYLAVVAAFAPGVAASGYSALPLAPWIGFAGLLYLVSLGIVLAFVRRTTAPASGTASGGVVA